MKLLSKQLFHCFNMEKIFNTTYHTCFCLYTPYPAHLFMLYVDHIYPDLSPERYKETKVKITALFSWYLSLEWMFLYYFCIIIVVHLLASIVDYLPDAFYFLGKSSTVGLAPSGKCSWPVFGVRNWSVHLFLRYLRIFDDFYSGSILQRLLFLEPKPSILYALLIFCIRHNFDGFLYFCGFSIVWWDNLFMLNKSIKPWGRIIQGGQKERIFFRFGYIPRPSSVQLHISSHHLDKELNLEPPKLHLYHLTNNLAAYIAPQIYSALRYLGVIFENTFYLVVPNLWMQTLQYI